MKFLKSMMLAASAAAIVASPAMAQTSVSVTFTGATAAYANADSHGRTGGAWYTNISSTDESVSLSNAIVYCIDNTRYFTLAPGSNYTYGLYTFSDFLATANTVSPWAPNKLTMSNLNAMADLAGGYILDDASSSARSFNTANQVSIWNISNNAAEPANPPGDFSNWAVLYNGKNQTFLVQTQPKFQTPEPATFALLASGLVGLVAVGRKRNS